ncbi:hypothetical protein JRO89_XS01G0027700 [Xanthoceras sorbifolium]|uniref:Uncharacterized protein n=1 Tax=Xanthoceras sorbifolium TaxID=99658 RepID=A0ABQ8IHX9_9ROSI|nr:hypothetical protein JRO89_XS01G0027700 [Xanthoceras sorbifolium]
MVIFCVSFVISGGITRIKSHLSGIKDRNIEICMKVPEDVQLAALQAISSPKNRARSLRALNNIGEAVVFSTSASIYEFPSTYSYGGVIWVTFSSWIQKYLQRKLRYNVGNVKKLFTTAGCTLVII